MSAHTYFIAAFGLYFMSMAATAAALFSRRAAWARCSAAGVWAGALFHFAGVTLMAIHSAGFPAAHPAQTYAFLSLVVVLLHLGMSLRYSVGVLSLFTLPLVQFLMLAAHLSTQGERDILSGYWLNLHIVLTFVSYAAFALAFVSGLGYLVQDRQLKSRHPGKMFRWLPPLGVLDEINTRTLVFGFLLLTLGLLAGFFWARVSGGSFWIEDPKVAWAGLIWFLYALLLSLRMTTLVRGRKVALGSVVGFALVVVSFVGVGHTVLH